MDSRTGFSLALILLGGIGMAFVFTGKFKNVLQALQAPGDVGWQNDAGQAGSAAGSGGSWGTKSSSDTSTSKTPASTAVSVNVGGESFNLPLGTLTTGPYSIPVGGTDGLAVAPYGAPAS